MSVETLRPASREEWLALRSSCVGASEVAALLGVHPYLSPFALWMSKTGQDGGLTEETAPMRRGRHLEQVAINFLAEERPDWRLSPNTIPGGVMLRDPDLRLSATPDCFAECPKRGRGLVQIKSIEPSVFRREWINEDTREIEPPLGYAVQTIVEAWLSGVQWAALAPLTVGHGIDLEIIDVPIHPGIVERAREKVAAFWQMVAEERVPEPDFGRDGPLIEHLYRADDGEVLDLTSDNQLPEILDERDRLSAAKGATDKRLKEIRAGLIYRLGPASAARVADGRLITAKTVQRKAYAVEATSYRDLRVKTPKEGRPA